MSLYIMFCSLVLMMMKSQRFIWVLISVEFLVLSLLLTISNSVLFIGILVMMVVGSTIGMVIFVLNMKEFGKDLSLI